MAKKEAGGKSASQNDFLEPLAPTNVTATDVGTSRPYDDGAITVTWEIDALSPAAETYTIQVSGGSVLVNAAALPTPAGSTYSATVTGLASNTSYTLEIFLTNGSGSSDATTASAVTVTTVPQAPQSVSATSTTANQDIISWSDGNDGGSTITSTYAVSSDQTQNPGNITLDTNPKTVSEVGDTSQTYTLYHVNANGTSEGATTASVTTVAPFFPPFFPPYFPPYFPPFFPPYFPPFFPPFFPPYFPPFFPPYFPPYFPPFFPPYFPPRFPYFPPYFPPFFPPRFAIYSVDPDEGQTEE